MKNVPLFIFLFFSVFLFGQSNLTDSYIDRYKDIAVSEMNRTGIPASITLAQGLLESNWGRSELAVKSNNHFGIKCSDVWEGETHYRFDDEYNRFGKKKKSCFREYDSPEDSYLDHSNFLTDPKKSKRYGPLFKLSPDDYRSWAKGLSRSGYATDPKYAKKLIQIIEKYELHQYDVPNQIPVLVELDVIRDQDYHTISYLNSCKIVLAMGGESVKDLSKEIGVSTRKIMKYNEHIKNKSQKLKPGEKIYLEKKKSYYLGKETFHQLDGDEDLAYVSNLYGIDESYLKTINDLSENDEPDPGVLIKLKAGRNKASSVAMAKPKVKQFKKYLTDNSDYLFEKALTPFKQ